MAAGAAIIEHFLLAMLTVHMKAHELLDVSVLNVAARFALHALDDLPPRRFVLVRMKYALEIVTTRTTLAHDDFRTLVTAGAKEL
jgi:hypothetical protein